MQDFFEHYAGYVLATIFLVAGLLKEALNLKQKKVTRLETEANAKKADLDYNEALRESYKETAAEWKLRYDEEKKVNLDLISTNKDLLQSIVKEQTDKTEYLNQVHKLREEVNELKAIILKFQEHFPEFFSAFSKINTDKLK